ncbi:phage tail tape measure protein [Isoptericola sp. NPDC056134]|uniref:phage tail tape measure protein n=1 Tax=Isoptericola sp. NPDC056134 TaxID=3345723 RepID=UPI0035E64812
MAEAPAIELATAYLSIVPSMSGVQGALAKELGGPAVTAAAGAAGEKAGKTFSTRMAKGGKIATAGLTLPLLAVGAAGLKAALDVDDAYDKIRAGTGATGKTLEGLQASFDKVAKTTPADMDAVSSTVADLNTRLGLTGPTLEKLSAQILEAGRLGGVDVDVQKITGAFSAFGVEGKKTTGAMDDIFRVSQATGVGINDLSAQMAKSGGILNQLGFGFTDSAALLGTLNKAGVNSNAVVASMQAGLVKLAKDGEAPQEAFKRVTGELQGFIDKGDDAKALKLAGEVFGTRGAGQFVSALKSGKVNLDDLTKSAGLSKDTILGVAEETKDFPELWTEFKNTATLALAPIGQQLMPAIGNALQLIAPYLEQFSAWFSGLSDSQVKVLIGVGAGLAAIGPLLWAASKAQQAWTVATKVWAAATKIATVAQRVFNLVMRANPIGLIITAVTGLVGVLVWFFTKTKTGKAIVAGAWRGIKAAIKGVADWWTKTAWPNIKKAIDLMKLGFQVAKEKIANVWNGIKNAVKVVASWISTRWDKMVTFFTELPGRIKRGFGNGWAFLKDKVKAVVGSYGAKTGALGVVRGMVDFFPSLGGRLARGAGRLWGWLTDRLRSAVGSYSSGGGGIKGMLWSIVNFIKSTLPNKIKAAAAKIWSGLVGNALDVVGGVMKLVGKIPGVDGTITLSAAGVTRSYKYADGGMMPGYTPGRDVHRFYSPTGGLLELSGGEPILRPEAGRVLGSGWVHGINAAARGGGISGVKQFLGGGQAFAGGGIWNMEKFRTPKGLPGPVAWLVKNTLGRLTVPSLLNATVKKILEHFGIGASGGGGKAPGNAGGKGLRGNLSAMAAAAKALDPSVRVTSGYRPGAMTVTGVPSMHGAGRAIDMVASNMGALWDRLYATYGKSSPELFFSGRAFSRYGVKGAPRQDHWDHVHWAMAQGGVIPKLYDQGGWIPHGGVGLNMSGKPEAVLTPDESQWLKEMADGQGGGRGDEIHFHGVDEYQMLRTLEMRARRSRARNNRVGR